ncbi:hypothetical protein KIPB_002631 [Kipferlia bialata]|uniref:PHD-type domain-containing protein n=1 Tax=Kipferlia bialata TaxID=797122 RepID=A0A9K3GG51_9EUKA|nr:hypothetical protein KIPB_002631 [Kipferlia bialata]|eukprot:g2631.t1
MYIVYSIPLCICPPTCECSAEVISISEELSQEHSDGAHAEAEAEPAGLEEILYPSVVCGICGEGEGDLIRCGNEGCTYVWHLDCLGTWAPEGDMLEDWLCPVCTGFMTKDLADFELPKEHSESADAEAEAEPAGQGEILFPSVVCGICYCLGSEGPGGDMPEDWSCPVCTGSLSLPPSLSLSLSLPLSLSLTNRTGPAQSARVLIDLLAEEAQERVRDREIKRLTSERDQARAQAESTVARLTRERDDALAEAEDARAEADRLTRLWSRDLHTTHTDCQELMASFDEVRSGLNEDKTALQKELDLMREKVCIERERADIERRERELSSKALEAQTAVAAQAVAARDRLLSLLRGQREREKARGVLSESDRSREGPIPGRGEGERGEGERGGEREGERERESDNYTEEMSQKKWTEIEE